MIEVDRKVFTIKKTVTETKVNKYDVLAESKETVEESIKESNSEKWNKTEGVNYKSVGYDCPQPCGNENAGEIIARKTTFEVIEKE